MTGAQNSTVCDSLVIECCSFDITQNTISLIASNYSSYLFDYPGFILYNSGMDTVAFETVNYFGIGLDQTHTLEIIHPLSLPFEGILELYTFFYDTLWCTFDVAIPDTVTSSEKMKDYVEIKIFPNPADDLLFIEFGSFESVPGLTLEIYNRLGQETYHHRVSGKRVQIPVMSVGNPGLYYVRMISKNGQVLGTGKLLLK